MATQDTVSADELRLRKLLTPLERSVREQRIKDYSAYWSARYSNHYLILNLARGEGELIEDSLIGVYKTMKELVERLSKDRQKLYQVNNYMLITGVGVYPDLQYRENKRFQVVD